MGRILYYSTNRLSPLVSFKEALLKGLAPDGGLYCPGRIPKIEKEELLSFKGISYPGIALSVLWKFLEGEIDKDVLENLCTASYNFEPVIESITPAISIMRLDRGPTASFKDFAARLMARLMHHFIGGKRELTILTATSGDTGSAVANAFYGMEGIRLVVLYPEDEVSDLQRKQMTTLGSNITALAVKGKFDDCQLMVKAAFNDGDLKDNNLSSANSINIGRLLPQMVYYFYVASRLPVASDEITFSIPSGNFGNMMGGVFAREMGLPVRKLIIAVNENEEFPRYLNDGIYSKIEPSINCISSAMNVGHPGNLARLLEIYGGRMNETGHINLKPNLHNIKKDISSYSISDSYTRVTIQKVWDQYKVLLEPHGAVAWAGMEHDLRNKESVDKSHKVIIETAHPAKFPDTIRQLLNFLPESPPSLQELEGKKETIRRIPASYDSLKKYLLSM